ncbi:MAG: 2-amino-4-hydroxy-6-hydroxymethyldihydropteridine diphosphokinase [Pseudomonadota bacterium]
MTHWFPAYVAIGCNVGDCAQQLRDARIAIDALPDVCCVAGSSVFRTAPVGKTDQPAFLNAAVGFLTTFAATTLLDELHRIERTFGRERSRETRWGPRTLDLDLLVYGSQCQQDDALTLPHPRIAERNFVLLPLVEIAPELEVPGVGGVRQLLERCATDGAQRITDFKW